MESSVVQFETCSMTDRDVKRWHPLHFPLLLSREGSIHGGTDAEDIKANICQTAGSEAAARARASAGVART